MKTVSPYCLEGEQLKVRDLLRLNEDIDVYDDVCEELGIAFCNPFDDDEVHEWGEYLTNEGMKKFGEVLDYPMVIIQENFRNPSYRAIVGVDDKDGVWQKKLKKAKMFFDACAGFINCDEYNKYFKF